MPNRSTVVIVSASNQITQAAKNATTSIPIAMMASAAPVGVDATSLYLKTAESLGLTVPPSMLLRADQVIK